MLHCNRRNGSVTKCCAISRNKVRCVNCCTCEKITEIGTSAIQTQY